MNKGDDVYPGSGPLDGGKTLCPALVYTNDDVSSTSLIYLEIVSCVLTRGLVNVIVIRSPLWAKPPTYIHAR